MNLFVEEFIAVHPSDNQITWQALEFTAFLHYGINTFTNQEWGDGTESPTCYNPSDLNTDQWCEALVAAGVKACIITAKHHDGFCLFDTAFTEYSVMNSPKPRDVVSELAASCVKYGLKLGVYLSPWDRHEPSYGSGTVYDDFFCAQLTELTTKYGPLYSVWFDGACGEGPNGKKQVYDWERYYSVIRKNQPNAVISVCGPDVRWIGNEAGYTRPSEWSVVPTRMRNTETTASLSQQSDDSAFREKPISAQDEDLGSRKFLAEEMSAGGSLCWYPAEVDVSIRPGWFYHKDEDNQVRSLENLLDIYEKSVGGNAVLLLNVPPDTSGRINTADASRLKELGDRIRAIYSCSLLADADADCGNNIFVDDDTYWIGSNECEEIVLTLPEQRTITHIVLCEQIKQSQRIEMFFIQAEVDGTWNTLCEGATVGFKKICRFAPVTVKNLRIVVKQSRIAPTLRFVAAYRDV